MHVIDVVTAPVAFLALAAVIWRSPLERMPFWGLVLLSCVTFVPARAIFEVLERSVGSTGAWADWVFTLSVILLFDVLLVWAYGALKARSDARADRRSAPTSTP